METKVKRKYGIGAEITDGGVHFRVWAPKRKKVEVIIENRSESGVSEVKNSYEMEKEEGGYFSVFVSEAEAGTFYKFKLDDDPNSYPDPASRYQPEGPHGPSMVIDTEKFKWSDKEWTGVPEEGQVIYEMHIGTFTKEGTFMSALKELPMLKYLGVTILELMPVADFTGRFGWGYDGVNLFAPTRLYGGPNDLKRFIDTAHSLGIGVILDVVYNHLGPDGNYLRQFADDYFSDKNKTDWGEAINFDGKNSKEVREYFKTNAKYWIEEFHFDGLRLDATQDIYDSSERHVIAEITEAVKRSGGKRKTFIVGENEPQKVILIREHEEGGYGLNALWNDDFHHTAMVALTGHNEAYYMDYGGTPQEFISTMKYGFLFQGQRYNWQKQRRGTVTKGIKPFRFITFIQNHDQIANSGRGLRAHQLTTLGRYKALTTLMLLGPGTPMLFQGQEFAASTPFFYFADHKPELAAMVSEGRAKFLGQFRSLDTPEMQKRLPNPTAESTFERSKLNLEERETHKEIYDLHIDLLRLRRELKAFNPLDPNLIDGAVLSSEAFVIRFFHEEGEDSILLVNLGKDLFLPSVPEPLLAPPEGGIWKLAWSSEHPRYGGVGTAEVETDEGWYIPGHAAVVLQPVKNMEDE